VSRSNARPLVDRKVTSKALVIIYRRYVIFVTWAGIKRSNEKRIRFVNVCRKLQLDKLASCIDASYRHEIGSFVS